MYAPSRMARTAPSTMTGALRRMRSAEYVRAQIRPERLRHRHDAIGALIVFEQRDDRARERQTGAVERVHQTWLLPRAWPIANARAACLEVSKARARRHLEPGTNTRRPHLQVVRLRRGKAGITRGQQHHPIRESETLQHAFRLGNQQLELRR